MREQRCEKIACGILITHFQLWRKSVSKPLLLPDVMGTRSANVRLLAAVILSLLLIVLSTGDAVAWQLFPELPRSLKDAYTTIMFLTPGIIILFVRSQFEFAYKKPDPRDTILSYTTISIVYYAIASLADSVSTKIDYEEPWHQVFLVLAMPIIFGALLGINFRFKCGDKILRCLGLERIPVFTSAWDWKFANTKEQWVIVTLKDGTEIFGFFGRNSFASSRQDKYDIYVEWVYDIDGKGNFSSRKEEGVLIPEEEIKTVRFLPFEA